MATTKIIQSIERAASILELFQDNVSELGLKDISELLNLNKSTTFGLVNSLTALGYLMQNEDNQRYSLGPKILSLSAALKMNNVLIRIAHPYLQELADKYHETVHSAIDAGGASVIYLDKVESDSSIVINTKMGVKNYMHCTGVGKCLLSFKSIEECDRILSFPLQARTYNTLTTRDALYKELELSRNRGYAMDNEEIEIGLSCVSFPVFRLHQTPGFAISVSGATSRMLDKIDHSDLLKDMRRISVQLSRLIYSYECRTDYQK